MNSLYPILRRILVQVTKIATTVFLLIVLIDYIEKLIAYNFKVVYQDYDGYSHGRELYFQDRPLFRRSHVPPRELYGKAYKERSIP